jgi:murein DD-endopeptidase MepM/ murein hydrolase activator NlpD
VRRQPFIAIAALVLGGAVVLAWPTIAEIARSPVPVGAVLPASAAPAEPPAPTLTPAPTAAATPSPEPTPSPIDLSPEIELIPPLIAPARSGDGPAPADPRSLTGYRWPLVNGVITSPFGPSPFGALLVKGERFHDGLDIASFCGDTVVAAHDGLVLAAGRKFDPWIGWIGSLGPHTHRMDALNKWWELPITVIIDDGNGYRSIYAHLNAVSVRPGQRIRAGRQIGWEGKTGFATGCHVHYGLFSVFETRRLELRPDVHQRTKYPRFEMARIDPLLVLPPLPHGRTVGPFPLPSPPASPPPSPSPTPSPSPPPLP